MTGAAFPSLSSHGAAFPRLSSHGSLTEPVESSISSLGTFWHVTDWHLNEFAPPNASARDLCRSAARAGDEQPGAFGHPDCDPSADLWELALARMAALAPSPDFVFAGGDWLGHVAEGRMSGAAALSSAVRLAAAVQRTFGPATPVLHAIGNHDTWPYYSLASTWREWERGWTAELGREYLERQFPGRSLAEWRGGGYYSRRLGASLRLVVLNTNQLALTDGTAQLDWLEAELVAARRARQRVLLLGHIPPGPSHYELDSICAAGHFYQRAGGACWRGASQARLLALLRAHADVVRDSVWGHHHTPSVRLVVDGSSGAAVHTMYLSPSLTPRNPPHDPGVRLYAYDRAAGELRNYTDFTFDVRRANRRGEVRWAAEPALAPAGGSGGGGGGGGATKDLSLGLASLAPEEWHRALRRLLASDGGASAHSAEEIGRDDPFLRYMSAHRCAQEVYTDSVTSPAPPLRRCKLAVLCAMLHVEDEPYARCIGEPLGGRRSGT